MRHRRLTLVGGLLLLAVAALAQTGEPGGSSPLAEAKRRAAAQHQAARRSAATPRAMPAGAATSDRAERVRIAVLPIKTASGLPTWWEGTFDPGRAIADLVVAGLTGSPRFTVYDRNSLEAVLTEHKLAATGMITAETAAEIGRLTGVQYLLSGSLVEFTKTTATGGGLSIPTKYGSVGTTGKRTKVRTVVAAQVIDVTTGLVAAAVSARDETAFVGGDFALSTQGYSTSGGHDQFASSRLGTSMNKVARQLVRQLETVALGKADPLPALEGVVMRVEGDQVFLNIGTREGVARGMTFVISRPKPMTDPVSGQTKTVRVPLAEVKIVAVQEDACVGTAPGLAARGLQACDTAARK